MNKTIEKIENYKERELNKALLKAKQEYDEAEDFYRDTGYDRYYKKMMKYEKEISELEGYLRKDEVNVKDLSTEQYKEYLQMKQDLKVLESKLFYFVKDLNLPMTADVVAMQDILRDYR